MKKVIVTGNAHPILMQTLTDKGFDVVYQPQISYEEIKNNGQGVSGLVLTTRIKVDKELIDALPQLEWIGRLGSGMELVDVDYARSKDILCASSPEGNRNAVAEHSLGLLLMQINKMNIAVQEVRQGIWLRDENRGTELLGKTVGIIGYGNTGSSFARLLQPFEVTVLAHDKYKTGFENDYIKEAALEQVCEEADIISFNVPLTAETHHFLNKELLVRLKKQPLIISACRGKVINTADLIEGLKNGQVRGACLDVLENEKLNTYTEFEKQQLAELLSFPGVIVTPHIAGYTHEAFLKMATVLLGKLGF
ncbi:NAD(P)-dependent oxidoreductase [Niabella yanshanensis]|uniref:NAD(P)-dependent oxidoreductase n=1 Tax=Niabella yanshanensis TaxID=577386 RepID=A0ABZ0WD21_9BACT|nr:NAD(P)-dependent oxidoreductase [Niabella yanshanensis]WQD40601.1 NAD(P)-dependent oxidoreductase [Niabella yanshanensis]